MTGKVFFVAVNTGFVDREMPSDEALRFYADRSGNGLYCAIIGNVVLPNGYGPNDVSMRISGARQWGTLAHAIREQGARPGIQLSTTWANFKGMRQFKVPRGENPLATYRQVAESFSPSDIDNIFCDLHAATKFALDAGFSHIQLHAAHGYLFCLLTDQSLCRHYELALGRITEWLIQLEEKKIESSVRVSLTTGNSELDSERPRTIETLCSLPTDFVDISDGYYNFNKHLIYPSKAQTLNARHEATMKLAEQFPNREFIVSGRAATIEKIATPNLHLGLCRDLIANPKFLLRRENGCVNNMTCHFYSTGAKSLRCGQW